MLTPAVWILAAAVSLAPNAGSAVPHRIDVDCQAKRSLQRALVKAQQFDDVDIYIHGVCVGNFTIAGDGVTLRAAGPDSGLASPEGDFSRLPVLEVLDAQASLRGLSVRGGEVGVLASGWDTDLLLYQVDVYDQTDVGVIAYRGAGARLIDSQVRDGFTGVVASSNSTLNFQNVMIRNLQIGVAVADKSTAALNDTTIENCRSGGLNVVARSDVNVIGGAFRENTDIHINANDFSRVTLLSGVTIGSDTDSTRFSLGANRGASIAAYSTPEIYGDVSAVDRGAIRLGNTVLDGDLVGIEFANLHVRNSEITGSVVCIDGADAICSQTTTGGAFGCGSPTCGSAPAGAPGIVPSVPEHPVVAGPRIDRQFRSRPRR